MLRDAMLLFTNELKSLFRDRGSLLVIVALPFFIMPVLFVGIYSSQKKASDKNETRIYALRVEGAPDGTYMDIVKRKLSVRPAAGDEADALVLTFSQTAPSSTLIAEISYSSATPGAARAIQVLKEAVSEYRMNLVKDLLEAKGAPTGIAADIQFTTRDRTPEKALSFSGLGGLIPYMLIVYIFSGALMIGIASTTAEKEKGSFSLLLLNRVDRGSIAIGKVAYVMVTGMMNSVASAAGLVLSGLLILKLGLIDLSKVGGSSGIGTQAFSAILSPWGFILFLLNLVVISALFSSVIIIVGLRSKTVKEANGYAMPFFLLILLAVIPTIASQGTIETKTFLVPVLNTAYCLKGIFEGTLSARGQALCFASNTILIAAAIFYVRQLFSSEKILYTV